MSDQQNGSHGWQPPLPQVDNPKNPQSRIDICYNFVWGVCQNGTECNYRHELDIACMRQMEIFCRPFQRLRQCLKMDCICIHASKQEVVLFVTKGKIPQALAERHPVLLSSSSNTDQNGVQITSQQPLSQVFPPPPPPPPPLRPAQDSVPSQTHCLPSHSSTVNPNFTVECLPSTSGSVRQTQLLPSRFDTSRPPPDLPYSLKRRLDEESEAGPSKGRRKEPKADPSESYIAPGRTEQYRDIVHDVNQREENYRKMCERWPECVSPEEEAKMNRRILLKLLAWAIKQDVTNFNTRNEDHLLNKTAKSSIDKVALLVQSLLTPRPRQTPDVLNMLLQAIHNSAASESSQERVAPPAERAGPSAGPSAGPPAGPSTRPPAGPSAGPSGGPSAAYPRFVNGQKMSVAPPPAAAAVRYPPVPQCAGAPPRTYVAPQPAPAYPPFQPAVPPPSRPYYPHHYHNNTTAAAPQHSSQYVYTQWEHPNPTQPVMHTGPPGLPPAGPETPDMQSAAFPTGIYGLPPTRNPDNER